MTRFAIQMRVFAYHSIIISLHSLLYTLFTVACSGLTPISEISTRAFVAYSWFGLPPLVSIRRYTLGTRLRCALELESQRSAELVIHCGGFSICDQMSTDPVDRGT